MDFVKEIFDLLVTLPGGFRTFFGPPRAPGWPETDSPRKMMASSGVDIQIRALRTRFVAIFRFWKNWKT